MRQHRFGWMGLAGIAMGAIYGACGSLETFLGDLSTGTGTAGTGGTGAAGGTGGTGGMPECKSGNDCADKQPPACQTYDCQNGNCTLQPLGADEPCGDGLVCDGMGQCKCTATSAEKCPVASECFAPFCDMNGTCAQTALTDESCNNSTGKCTADGACLLLDGYACTMGSDCISNNCVDSVCCNQQCNGKCMACINTLTNANDGECATIAEGEVDSDSMECDDKGACSAVAGWCECEDGIKQMGETDVDCGGQCGAKCTTGMTCKVNEDCASGNPCVDGVCCTNSCSDPCFSCNEPGFPGLCRPIGLLDDPNNCSGQKTCHPEGVCGFVNGDNSTCNNNAQCASGACSSSNKCAECSQSNDCPGQQDCVDGVCYSTTVDNSDPCINDSMCSSQYCADGVCCESKCSGLCMACNTAYTSNNNGLCRPILAGYDPKDDCADGPGNVGTCSGAMPDMMGNSSCK